MNFNKQYKFFFNNSINKHNCNYLLFNKLGFISVVYFYFIRNKQSYSLNKDNTIFNNTYFNKFIQLSNYNNSLSMLSSTEVIKGEYENKLRIFSPLEKRYIIFGKIKKLDDKMTYIDFFDSLIPFQYMETARYEDLKNILEDNQGEFNKLFKEIVDVNNDGKISFEEYSVFCFIISNCINNFNKQLQINKKDYFTKEELTTYLFDNLVSKVKVYKIEDKAILDSRVVRSDKNELKSTIETFYNNSFKFKDKVYLKDIKELKFNLFKLLSYYEYYRIITNMDTKIANNNDIESIKNRKIPADYFAKVFISYINIYKNRQIIEKLNNNQYNFEGEFDFNDFLNFFWFCNEFHDIKKALKDHSLNAKELCELSNKILDNFPDKNKRLNLTEKHINIVYEILDTDKNGLLSIEEIDEVFKRRDFFNTNEEYSSIINEFKTFFKKLYSFVKSNFPTF